MSASARRVVILLLAGPAAVAGLVACGGDDGDSAPPPSLSAAGEEGRGIARDAGCASCHGDNGQGGVGPEWVDLAGSEVELEDGSTVTADTEYLVRAITEPDAEKVDGYAVEMPENDLSDDEVASIVAYIEELGS
jgi:cytochrome c oxidase subunit 2